MEELKKFHWPDVQDPRSVSFNHPAAYAMGGGSPHDSNFQVLSVYNTNFYCRLALGDGVVDRGTVVSQNPPTGVNRQHESREARSLYPSAL
jgi:hypothetical protein